MYQKEQDEKNARSIRVIEAPPKRGGGGMRSTGGWNSAPSNLNINVKSEFSFNFRTSRKTSGSFNAKDFKTTFSNQVRLHN